MINTEAVASGLPNNSTVQEIVRAFDVACGVSPQAKERMSAEAIEAACVPWSAIFAALTAVGFRPVTLAVPESLLPVCLYVR